MSRTAYPSRLRQALLGSLALLLAVSALMLLALGAALLVAGLLSWLRPVNAASDWARTLAGVGLVGGSVGFAALAWLASGAMTHRRTLMNRKPKFAAVIGCLPALVCLPFGAAIGTMGHVSWFG